MLDDLDEEQYSFVAEKLGIEPDYVRKDYFVTKVIQSLGTLSNDYFSLVFKGGTSLVKAHKIVNRLSEDVDFRIVATPLTLELSANNRRTKLRDFRHQIVNTLKETGFQVESDHVKVMYEGQYMNVAAHFPDGDLISYLKPHVEIECYVGDIKLPPINKPITSLIKETLNAACNHPIMIIPCYSLEETTVEKWVALTRRVYDTLEKERKGDKDLVRHIYDLHHLQQHDLNPHYISLVHDIVRGEHSFFSKEALAFNQDAIKIAMITLRELRQNDNWEKRWDVFTQKMVYDNNKPSYSEALNSVKVLSNRFIEELKQNRP